MARIGLGLRQLLPAGAAALLTLGVLDAPRARSEPAGDLAPAVREQLTAVLQGRVNALTKEQDDAGRRHKRGFFSRSFHRVDARTFEVAFHQDTAASDLLKTERLLLTLGQDPTTNQWTVTDERTEDVCSEFRRSAPGDETFAAFDAMHFQREGLTVRATNGVLFEDFRAGEPIAFTVAAQDLAYSYAPPADVEFHQVHRFVQEREHKDLTFTPQSIAFYCDPASCAELRRTTFTKLRPIDKAAGGAELARIYDGWRRDAERDRREDPFGGFVPPRDPDRRFWTATIRRSSEHAISLSYDSWDPWQVRFRVGGRTLYAHPDEATRKSGVSPDEIERQDDVEARDYEVESIEGVVELALQDAQDMAGDVVYGLRAKRALARLPFRISRLRRFDDAAQDARNPAMIVNSVQDAAGRELTWVKTGQSSGYVLLGQQVPAGASFKLRLQWEAKKAIYAHNWSYSYVDRGGWLPFVRFGDMIHKFDLTVKTPARYQTLGVCTKVAERREGDVLVTRWTARNPVEFPTVIFGEYVEDAAGTPARRLDGALIPVRIYVDRNGMTDWGITPKQLRPIADQAAEALGFYAQTFGADYPYAKLDLVNDPLGALYGQAPSSIVYLGSAAFRGEGALGTWAGSNATKFVKSLVSHEVAHQWWGSLVANANNRHYWLVESLAELSSALYVEAKYGRQAYLDHVRDWRSQILEAGLWGSVQNASELWSGESGGYYASVYNKGPYVLHILRTTFGDEKFARFLKLLAAELAGKEVVSRDIQRVAETAFGGSLDWFFDQWIRGRGLPEYRLAYSVRPTEDGKHLVEGKVRQRVVVGLKKFVLDGVYFRGLASLTIEVGKQEIQRQLLIEGPETDFRFKIAEKPRKLVLNKYGETLAQSVAEGASF